MSTRPLKNRPALRRRPSSTPVAEATTATPGMAAGVEVGQIWEDCDPRHLGRRLCVLKLDGHQAVCRTLVRDAGCPRGYTPTGRMLRIQLVRLRPRANGYRLVYQPGAGTDAATLPPAGETGSSGGGR